jgi:hypothetical protein
LISTFATGPGSPDGAAAGTAGAAGGGAEGGAEGAAAGTAGAPDAAGTSGAPCCANAGVLAVNIKMEVTRNNIFIYRIKTRRLCRCADKISALLKIINRLTGCEIWPHGFLIGAGIQAADADRAHAGGI